MKPKRLLTIKLEFEGDVAEAKVCESDPLLFHYLECGWKVVGSEEFVEVPKKTPLDRVRALLPENYRNWEP